MHRAANIQFELLNAMSWFLPNTIIIAPTRPKAIPTTVQELGGQTRSAIEMTAVATGDKANMTAA